MGTNNKKYYNKKKSNSNQFERLEEIIESEDILEWPDSWAGFPEDVPVGQKLLPYFKLYLQKLLEKNLTKKTIKTHGEHLWVLGGEIIREIHDCEEDRNKTGKEILLKYIHDSGGPYWPHADNEDDHKRYDSVCKRLWKLVKYG